jgi:hypothetical protein
MTHAHDRLADLGDALHAAARADLAHTERRRRRRTLGGVLAATAIVLPGAALAANALITGDDVADSIPKGTLVLMGTDPRCTTVRANVEFDCVLSTVPKEGDVAAGAWNGTVEPTVDRSRHVNGGCRSLNAQGTHWRCYIGEEAVRQNIVGAGLLGQFAPTPGRG